MATSLYAAKVSDIPTEKKPRTEKQIAAFAKAQETRKRKREEADLLKEEEIKKKEAELAQTQKALEEAEEKRRVANEKRRLAREAKKVAEPVAAEEAPPALVLPKAVEPATVIAQPSVVKKDDGEPPNWFKKYVENVKQNENDVSTPRKAQKVVKQEAREIADQKWALPNVRAQVNKSVDSHLDRMYKEIFCIRG